MIADSTRLGQPKNRRVFSNLLIHQESFCVFRFTVNFIQIFNNVHTFNLEFVSSFEFSASITIFLTLRTVQYSLDNMRLVLVIKLNQNLYGGHLGQGKV